MITRYEETPRVLATAIQEAMNGQPSKAVLVFRRDLNGVHLASTIIRVHLQRSDNFLRVEVGMIGREGNPFYVPLGDRSVVELVPVVEPKIELIVQG